MNIRELIDALERRAEDSDEGYNAKVKLSLHATRYNASGYYIETEIVDVSNVWGNELDECLIEAVLSEEDVNKLSDLKNGMLGINQ